MYTILDVINSAFRKAGITAANGMRQATPEMIDNGFAEYKEMMSELAPIFKIGADELYAGDVNQFVSFPDQGMSALAHELGKRLAPIYQVALTDQYLTNARQSMETFQVLMVEVPELKRRADMPKGAGWKDYMSTSPFYPHTEDNC